MIKKTFLSALIIAPILATSATTFAADVTPTTGVVYQQTSKGANTTVYADGTQNKVSGAVYASSIKLDKTALATIQGQWVKINATFNPASTTNQTVKWTSNNENIVKIWGNGKKTTNLLARNIGTATITATTSNGKKATCKVTVKESLPTSVTIEKNKVLSDMNVKETTTLKANVICATPSNKVVTWKSSNPKVATVDKNGKVTALKEGTAKITATTVKGNKTASVDVKVIPKVNVTFHYNAEKDFTYKETYKVGVKNQSFGMKLTNKNGHFGTWYRSSIIRNNNIYKYKLLGWSDTKNATKAKWSTYSGVSDAWIRANAGNKDLYAVWQLAK